MRLPPTSVVRMMESAREVRFRTVSSLAAIITRVKDSLQRQTGEVRLSHSTINQQQLQQGVSPLGRRNKGAGGEEAPRGVGNHPDIQYHRKYADAPEPHSAPPYRYQAIR